MLNPMRKTFLLLAFLGLTAGNTAAGSGFGAGVGAGFGSGAGAGVSSTGMTSWRSSALCSLSVSTSS